MSRSLKKGPYIYEKLLKKISVLKPMDGTVVKTWARDSQISPEMIGFTFGVHNGKDFIQVRITEDMIGLGWESSARPENLSSMEARCRKR